MKKWMKVMSIYLCSLLAGCTYFQPTDQGGMVNEVKEIVYIKNSEMAEESFSVRIVLNEGEYFITANDFYDQIAEKSINVENKKMTNEQFEKVCEFVMQLSKLNKTDTDEFMLDGTITHLTIETSLGGKDELAFNNEHTNDQLEEIFLDILRA